MSLLDDAKHRVSNLESEFPALNLTPEEREKLTKSLSQLLSMLTELDHIDSPDVTKYVVFRR